MKVEQIPSEEAVPWIMKKHYARRMPPISYAFGLFEERDCVGVVTYGIPASGALCMGICGKKYESLVMELNRLCVDSKDKNACSFLVGRSLRLLPKPRIVVSYADTAKDHVGYIYQATNFLYTGLSASRKDFIGEDQGNKHSRHTIDKYGSVENAKRILGDKAQWVQRSSKHRYVFFLGDKKEIREMRSALNYPICPYPKGDTKRYDASAEIVTQTTLF